MCFDVPGGVPHHRARLEAVFEPSRMLDGWTCQLARHGDAHRRAHPRDRASAGTEPGRPQPRRRRGAADRIEPRDSRRARSDRARRRDRFHRPDRRRSRARARSSSRGRFTSSVAGARDRSSRSTARRSSRRCSRRSCSASRSARRPAFAAGAESSSTRTRGRCFSTRCRTSRRRRRRSCCARFRICRSSASAASDRGASTPASSWRPTGRCPVWWSRAASGWTSTTGCTASTSRCRRCARGARTSPSWPGTFSSGIAFVRQLQLSTAARRCAARLRLAGQRARAGARRSSAPSRWPARTLSSSTTCRRRCSAATRTCSCRRCARASRCARGEAATRGWCYERCGNNKRQACRELGISYHTLTVVPGVSSGSADAGQTEGGQPRPRDVRRVVSRQACRAPPAANACGEAARSIDDRGGCAPHRSLSRNGLHQRENCMAGRVMLAVVLAAAVMAAAAPAVRAASAGPPAQGKTPPKVVFDNPPSSETVEIDGRKNPEMIPQWDVWQAAFEIIAEGVGPAHRRARAPLEGGGGAGRSTAERENGQNFAACQAARAQARADAPDRRSEVRQRTDARDQSRVSLADASIFATACWRVLVRRGRRP